MVDKDLHVRSVKHKKERLGRKNRIGKQRCRPVSIFRREDEHSFGSQDKWRTEKYLSDEEQMKNIKTIHIGIPSQWM
jgi:hypothetical protein